MRPYLKNTQHKKTTGGVAQGIGCEFKPQYKKKKREKYFLLDENMRKNRPGGTWLFPSIINKNSIINTQSVRGIHLHHQYK
jgi:hypothetical protein